MTAIQTRETYTTKAGSPCIPLSLSRPLAQSIRLVTEVLKGRKQQSWLDVLKRSFGKEPVHQCSLFLEAQLAVDWIMSKTKCFTKDIVCLLSL